MFLFYFVFSLSYRERKDGLLLDDFGFLSLISYDFYVIKVLTKGSFVKNGCIKIY